MEGPKFNTNNHAVKRILREAREMQKNPSPDFVTEPLADNIFEWYFAIRGPPQTEFEGLLSGVTFSEQSA